MAINEWNSDLLTAGDTRRAPHIPQKNASRAEKRIDKSTMNDYFNGPLGQVQA
jgi:hypothetical protein